MSIELDVHGLTVEETVRTIQRLIVDNPYCSCIEVIHGFNNGSKIKNALSNKFNIHSKRVIGTAPVPYNAGRTLIYLRV